MGLEPTTPTVTGWCANRLRYAANFRPSLGKGEADFMGRSPFHKGRGLVNS